MKALRRGLRTALVAAALATPAGADAQDRLGVTLGAGAIGGADAAPDTSFAVPAYVISGQGVIKNRFVIEGELAHWAHTVRKELGPHDIVGPNGFLGTVAGTSIVDAHRVWNIGVNFLVRSTGRVRVFGGVGGGMSTDNTRYSQESSGCSPSLDPRTCTRFVSERSRGPVPIFRVLGGVEVPVTSWLGMVGAARAEASAWEDRRNVFSGIAGIRFSR
jgi:hypothetical protein